MISIHKTQINYNTQYLKKLLFKINTIKLKYKRTTILKKKLFDVYL